MRSSATSPTPARERCGDSKSSTSGCRRATGCCPATWPGSTPKYDEFITAGTNIADSQRFTNAPEFSGAVNLEYRTELARGGSLSTRVGYSYQSEVYPTTDLSEAIRQPGYGLLNAGVIWKSGGPWTLSLQGSNLADEEYRTTGYNIGVLGILTGFYGPPRQYSLSVRYDF
jgi:iron complex outermembrane recepter protein